MSDITLNNNFIHRCLELAILGRGMVSPNPTVGSLLADADGIIGEGWHRKYGQEHAEINALKSISKEDYGRIPDATLFVSLEPCSIHGQTPPCTSAIIDQQIKKVVVSAKDQTKGVSGKSEMTLKAAGIQTKYGVSASLGHYVAAYRNIYLSQKRPYVILKWAQTEDGFLGRKNERTKITNAFTDRYVHQIRGTVDAILIGSNTLKEDNPSLTTRLYSGKDALRIILAPNVSIDDSYKVFQDDKPALLFSNHAPETRGNKECFQLLGRSDTYLHQVMNTLYDRKITSLLVEGGANTLDRFIQNNIWDECRILSSSTILGKGIAAPKLKNSHLVQRFDILEDHIQIRLNRSHPYITTEKES